MLLSISMVIGGLLLLAWAAGRLVNGAAALARNLGVAPMIIGLTVVGLGTSAPEIVVSTLAAWQGNAGLAIGNAIGSNIANMSLVVGSAALVAPLVVQSETLRREFPMMMAVMLFALVLMLDGDLVRLDGAFFLLGLAVVMYWLVAVGMASQPDDALAAEFTAEIPRDPSTIKASGWLALSLVVLLVSSQMLVSGAVDIARALGVSDLVIGLTLVAVGTSLPELAATVASAVKREHDIAIGNIIGSTMFNLLAVLGIAAAIQPEAFAPDVLTRDYPVMIGLAIILFAMAYGFRGPGRINRVEGAVLLAIFAGYQTWLLAGR
jgi:cation:H+ antiporter